MNRTDVMYDRPHKRRSAAPWFGTLGNRLTQRARNRPAEYDQLTAPRFPINRHGYDREAVDQHLAELEIELAELGRELAHVQSHGASREEIALEIERIGEQTSAILVAAHEEAQQTVLLAETHANSVIADAASYAAALTEQASLRVRELEASTGALCRDRVRLLDDVRATASALNLLAADATDRLPPPAASGYAG